MHTMRLNVSANSFLLSTRFHVVTLAVAWIALHLVLFLHFGIVTKFEAHKYIEEADYLLREGQYSTPNFRFYSVQILLLAACQKLGAGYWVPVAVQLFFNAASTACFYKLVLRFTGQKPVAFFFTLAFLGMFYYQLYNVHLFTESLYFSFSLLFFYRLCSFSRVGPLLFVEVLLWLLLLYFTRPVGIYFLPAAFLFLTLKFFRQRASLILATAGFVLICVFVLLLNRSMGAGGEFDFLLPYTEGQVICGVPSSHHELAVPANKNSVQGLAHLITHYPGVFFPLFAKRLLAFFGVVRSYYSLPHNVFIAVYFGSLYVLSFAGVKKHFRRWKPEVYFALALIFFTALTSGLSCDEWHNRFLYAVFPFLMLLGSLAFATVKEPVSTNRR